MSKNPHKRNCSAVCSDGRPCRAWAVIDSDPPLCSVHAGLNVGRGGKQGNRNAMKHGLYSSALQPDEIANLEVVQSRTVEHELLLARAVLRRLARYMEGGALPLADMLAIAPVMSTMMRTVGYLMGLVGENAIDWDAVLDEVGKGWEIEI